MNSNQLPPGHPDNAITLQIPLSALSAQVSVSIRDAQAALEAMPEPFRMPPAAAADMVDRFIREADEACCGKQSGPVHTFDELIELCAKETLFDNREVAATAEAIARRGEDPFQVRIASGIFYHMNRLGVMTPAALRHLLRAPDEMELNAQMHHVTLCLDSIHSCGPRVAAAAAAGLGELGDMDELIFVIPTSVERRRTYTNEPLFMGARVIHNRSLDRVKDGNDWIVVTRSSKRSNLSVAMKAPDLRYQVQQAGPELIKRVAMIKLEPARKVSLR